MKLRFGDVGWFTQRQKLISNKALLFDPATVSYVFILRENTSASKKKKKSTTEVATQNLSRLHFVYKTIIVSSFMWLPLPYLGFFLILLSYFSGYENQNSKWTKQWTKGSWQKVCNVPPHIQQKAIHSFSSSFIQEGWLTKKMSWQDGKRMCNCSGFRYVSLFLLPTLVVGLSLLATKSRCFRSPGKGLPEIPKKVCNQRVPQSGHNAALRGRTTDWCGWSPVVGTRLISPLLSTGSPSSRLTFHNPSLMGLFLFEVRMQLLGEGAVGDPAPVWAWLPYLSPASSSSLCTWLYRMTGPPASNWPRLSTGNSPPFCCNGNAWL